ncbi:hypothetical protein CKO_01201 [Citrobacter koseri ATCC BAA-895]|uniref:Uncharacterized protein n=1 Tax=Citrobacter koseri (strain ATCC BAA-895 / CDC 4225-83 / SGSC4696) TaxID=290338 RepID=A8AFS8_CITK8|nr:hypothetical protein CKO_01201 [Citrobacter koseri ATCC BAA-895]
MNPRKRAGKTPPLTRSRLIMRQSDNGHQVNGKHARVACRRFTPSSPHPLCSFNCAAEGEKRRAQQSPRRRPPGNCED